MSLYIIKMILERAKLRINPVKFSICDVESRLEKIPQSVVKRDKKKISVMGEIIAMNLQTMVSQHDHH